MEQHPKQHHSKDEQHPNHSESLVEKACSRHSRDVFAISVTRNSQLDVHGVDLLLYLKIPSGHLKGRLLPFPVPLQVKRSHNGQTVGVLIIPNRRIPKSIEDRLSHEMKVKIDRHEHAHPEVQFFLFVRDHGKHVPEEELLDEIWKEIQEIMEHAKAYYREALTVSFNL